VFEDEKFSAAIARVARMDVFYSHDDYVLTEISKLANSHRALGGEGPKYDAKVPKNVIFHDMTGKLGHADVHSAYLLNESAVPAMVAWIFHNSY
jgi:hypothetical protein